MIDSMTDNEIILILMIFGMLAFLGLAELCYRIVLKLRQPRHKSDLFDYKV